MVSKDAFNIDGLGKKVVDKFWGLGLIKKPADIFELDYEKIKNLEGWGYTSVNNLRNSIKKSSVISLDKFIYSVGIRHIGQENAKLLSNFFIKIDKLKELFDPSKRKLLLNSISDLDGIGTSQIKSLDEFFSNKINFKSMNDLIAKLKVQDFRGINKKGKLAGKSIMFTGGFQKMSRSEAKSLVEENGGKVLGSLSKKLDMIVVGDSKPTKKKIEKAKELKIKVISEIEWYKLLNI